MKVYDVETIKDSRFSEDRFMTTATVTLQDLDFKREFTKSTIGNCRGLDVLSVICDQILEENEYEILLFHNGDENSNSDETYLLCADDYDDIADYIVKFEIVKVENIN